MQIPGMSGEPEVELLFDQLSYKCAGIKVYISIYMYAYIYTYMCPRESKTVFQ